MADPHVKQATGVFTGTVGSTVLVAGDPVYFDGTDWERADADDEDTYAEAISVNSFASGVVGAFCRSCIIVDTDSPYTQGDQYYLTPPAGTQVAGGITATRPTGANNLVQLLGYALSGSELYVDIQPIKEHQVWLVATATTGAEGAGYQLDSGNHGAYRVDADDEDLFYTFEIPQNCVGLEIAHIWTGAEVAGGSSVMDIAVSAAVNDEAHGVTTADTSFADVTVGATADYLYKTAVTTCFDAAGIWEPGNLLGIKIIADGGGTDIWMTFGINMVLKVV